MKHLIGALALLLTLAPPALAGRNANGAIVVHTDDAIVYTATADFCPTALPSTCALLITRTDRPVEEQEAVIWLLAAFLPEANPAVTTVQFGIRHNLPPNLGYFTRWAACGPSPLELPDTGWPEPNECGNLVAYSGPVAAQIFPFYWFAAIGVIDGYFGTRTYPTTNEAKFVDDGNPPVEDACVLFGTVRWGAAGENHCPVALIGACCIPGADCQILGEDECAVLGGTYIGNGTACEPDPCEIPTGACCLTGDACVVVTLAECEQQGGTYQGHDTLCDPNPCTATRFRVTTWGKVRATFR
jgi:hypothetical protein